MARRYGIKRFLIPQRNLDQLSNELDEEKREDYDICQKQLREGFRGFENIVEMIAYVFSAKS